ncbi:MAG TPA: hypothetical protein VHQ47_19040 [Phycisphaerae bacterium]|nr:hypothetical protein [Phycisphaerae bacterium]
MPPIPFDLLESRATGWRTAFRRTFVLAFLGVLAESALALWAVARHSDRWVWIFFAVAAAVCEVASIAFMSWYPTHRYGITCPYCHSQLPKAWEYLKRTGRCNECRHVVTIPPPPAPPPRVPWSRNPLVRCLLYLALVPIIIGVLLPTLIQRGIILLPPGMGPTTLALSVLATECFIFAFIPLGLVAERLRSRRLAEDFPVTSPYPVLEVVRPSHLAASAYRVYFAPGKLCFARVAGFMHSENGAFSKGEGAIFLAPFLQRSLRQKRRREVACDAIDPASDDLLAIDKRNFHLLRPAVQSLTYKPRYQMSRRQRIGCAPDATGLLTILADGKAALWLVYADLSPEEITGMLGAWLGDAPTASACLVTPNDPQHHSTSLLFSDGSESGKPPSTRFIRAGHP